MDCQTCEGRKHGIFCKLEKAEVDLLNQSKNPNIYKKGQNLFLEGNPPYGLYCVHNGKAKVTKTTVDGKEVIVRIVSAGGILGHRSLFSDTPYTASATMIEEGIVCFVSKECIFELIKVNPQLSFEIIEALSKQMGAAEERLASMSQKSLRERFAETLLLLKESFGVDEGGRIKIDIHLTREEMASMVGAAPENLIRLISEYKKNSWIEQEGKTLFLKELHHIEGEANFPY